ncbi:glucoamylase family protein [Cyclobacterium qasimii]|uniref:Glycoamylase-like domain-containing protein n=2 Tax=Cyclobacterium qasimii TaxID=1350429 RepID=S7VK01_9BACT|nr:glucoamylase family protein [Cyclobacterium qasimii]EPR69827.1 hypothetical protein ADICYQ_1230 [Cyclobacterium qasimii M12-11B]
MHRIIITRYLLLILLFSCQEETSELPNIQLTKAMAGQLLLVQDYNQNSGIGTDQGISVFFSTAIDPGKMEEAISLKEELSGELVKFNVNFLDSNKEVVLRPIGLLKEGATYLLRISSGALGNQGTFFPGYEVKFTTQSSAIEVLSFAIDGAEWAGNRRWLNANTDFSIGLTFSKAIDLTIDQIKITQNGIPMQVNLEAGEDERNWILKSPDLLDGFKKHALVIGFEQVSSVENDIEDFAVEFFTGKPSVAKFPLLDNAALLTLVQQQTFNYFWDFAHPASGMIRERNTSGDIVTTGGTGFGMMAIIVGIERGFITRNEGVKRWAKVVAFLSKADKFHGAWPHWMNGSTGKVIPFSLSDDGGDIVETALLIQGLLTVKEYLNPLNATEKEIRDNIDDLWEAVEWDWYTRGGQNKLFWHWSPANEWIMNLAVTGYNEALIVYVLAASSSTYPIDAEVYHKGWAGEGKIINGNNYFGHLLPLGTPMGGPLFFSHYSFLGLDPRPLRDQYADYWEQNVSHSLIHLAYSEQNSLGYVGYGSEIWGLTASDNHLGYGAHSPTNDIGVIAPTAALSSMPYTPEASMAALELYYYGLGDKLWGQHGFHDAFNLTEDWFADSYLAIDQGPIIIMIENHRTGLLWKYFMQNQEVKDGLDKLGFSY